MNTTDPIADMLTRIRNANTSKHRTVFNESYEEFYNKTNKSYDEYIESFYENKEICRRFNFDVDDESYETQIQDLYETLLSSSSNDYFIDCFRQRFRNDFVRADIQSYIDDHKVDGCVKLKVKRSPPCYTTVFTNNAGILASRSSSWQEN